MMFSQRVKGTFTPLGKPSTAHTLGLGRDGEQAADGAHQDQQSQHGGQQPAGAS